MSNNVATNTKNEGRCSFSRKALSVATAAVLATSMVPMLPAESAWADENASMLAVSDVNAAWKLATVTVNADVDADGDYYFTETANPVDFKVLSVVDGISGETLKTSQFEVKYEGVGDTTYASNTTAPTADGTYKMVVKPAGDLIASGGTYQGCTEGIEFPFMIADAAVVTDISLYQKHAGSNDTTDTDFYWTGSAFNAIDSIGLLVDGVSKELKHVASNTGNGLSTGDYYIKSINGNTLDGSDVINAAGTYRLGIAKYVSGQAGADTNPVLAYLDLEVKAFDLSKATFVIKDSTAANNIAVADNVTVKIGEDVLSPSVYADGTNLIGDGSNATAVVTEYEPAKGLPNPGVSGKFDALGKYTVKIAADKDDKLVAGEATATVNVVAELDDDFKYAGTGFATAKNSFDASIGEAFDVAKVTNDSLDAEDFVVTVLDAEGNEVSDWSKPGKYTAVAQVNVDSKFAKGGSDTFDFEVLNGGYWSAVVSVDGKVLGNGETATPTYNGEAFDVFTDVKLTNQAGDKVLKTLVKGTDYTLSIKKDGKVVDEIKDYGTYEVEIVSDTYTFSTPFKYTVSVGARNVTDVVIDQGTYEVYGSDPVKSVKGILWTGESIVPVLKYESEEGSDKFDTVLPSSAYTATYQKLVNAEEEGVVVENADGTWSISNGEWETVSAEEVKDAGFYRMTINDASGDKNYSVAQKENAEFRIVKTVSFTDVSSDAWYAPEIAKAVENGYISGLAGTTLFMPNADITRADTSVILYRMATGTVGDGEAGSGNVTFPSVFDDVAGNEYYAQAVNWATKAGVVGGYADTDLFGPNDNATREQIATMLYRYMKAMGKDVTVEDEAAALAKYADGASVSEYAKTAMAYCVEQGIFGVDVDSLRPQDNMSRAEMAATAVRVQPKAINA